MVKVVVRWKFKECVPICLEEYGVRVVLVLPRDIWQKIAECISLKRQYELSLRIFMLMILSSLFGTTEGAINIVYDRCKLVTLVGF